jgi:hypothetical protein
MFQWTLLTADHREKNIDTALAAAGERGYHPALTVARWLLEDAAAS